MPAMTTTKTKTITALVLLGLGSLGMLGMGCTGGSNDAGTDAATGETVGEETSTSAGTSGTDNSEVGDTSTGDTGESDTGEDPNAACASTWDATQKQATGKTLAAYGVAVAGDGNFVAVGKLENADDDAWISMFSPSGEPIWTDTVDGGQGKDYAQAVTFDGSGDVVLVGSLDNLANKDLWIEKRSAADGAIAWTLIEPSDFDGDNLPADIELAGDGSLVMAATLRTGDKDSDIHVRKLASADGSTVWAANFSGVADPNGYSIDRASSVGVAADGSIYVGGEEGVDATTKEGTLLKYGSAGGAEQWRLAPREDGSDHLHEVVAVEGGPEGEAYFVVFEGGDLGGFWLYRASAAGSVEWELSLADFTFEPTDGWLVSGLDLAEKGTLTIGGRLTNEEVGQAISWSEAWIADIQLDGVGECLSTHTWKNTHVIPASTYAYAFAEGPNGVVAVGEIIDGPENYLWLGGFE